MIDMLETMLVGLIILAIGIVIILVLGSYVWSIAYLAQHWTGVWWNYVVMVVDILITAYIVGSIVD